MISVRPTPWQARVLTCPATVMCIGGSRGPGKTDALLLDWARYQAIYGSTQLRGILTRPTYPQMQEIISKSRRYFLGNAKWNKGERTWQFPNGSQLVMRYLGKPEDADEYQGHEYIWQGHDDVGNVPDLMTFDKMEACMRSSVGAPPRMILSCNPGGRGHNQLKTRYVDAGPWGKIIDNEVEVELPTGKIKHTRTQCYIHGTIEDNPHITDRNAYIAGIAANNPEWLVKAWISGDWDIVAGGALDDVWNRERHVIPFAEIPQGWRVDRGFDWGSASPFSVLWFAESDGTPMNDRTYPRGSVIVCREWYGARNGTEDGLNMTAAEIAIGIKERERGMMVVGRDKNLVQAKSHPGPADNSINEVSNGNCIADDMSGQGIRWTKSNKGPGSRIAGLNKVRGMLKEAAKDRPEKPGLWIMDSCPRLIGHLPVLTRDSKKIEDIDTNQADHDYDVLRYRLLAQKHSTQTKQVKGFY